MNERSGETERLQQLLAEAIGLADPTLAARLEEDPGAYLDLIRLGARAAAYTDGMLADAVEAARSAGHSWEAIGAELSISKQAAHKRFGTARLTDADRQEGTTAPADAGGVQQRVLSRLTGFNEMSVLERVGKYGWHSVGYGPMYHLVLKSPHQWQHARVATFGTDSALLEGHGWQRIGQGWFPWSYYKRELPTPALPEPPGWDPLKH